MGKKKGNKGATADVDPTQATSAALPNPIQAPRPVQPQPVPVGKKKGKKGTAADVALKPESAPVLGQQVVKPAMRALQLPARTGEGASGRPIKLSANHFAVKISNQFVYHYDIDIQPVPPQALFRKIVFQFLAEEPHLRGMFPVFDGKKNVYTSRIVPGLDRKRDVNLIFKEPEREIPRQLKFVVSIQPTGEVEVDVGALLSYCNSRNASSLNQPLRAIQSLDIALKYGVRDRKISIENTLVSKELGKPVDLGGGVEVWFGHFQSLRLGWKPFLNVDATQRAFMKSGLVHEIMADMYRTDIGKHLPYDWQYTEFSKKIASLKVSYSRGAYVANVGCNGVKGPANKATFDCDGKKVTVQQYFESKYKMKLKYPHLPCVWVGSRDKMNLVPMEICSIAAGQEYRRKLNDIQMSNMIKVAATPADLRKQKILNSVKDMKFSQDSYAKSFGISVDSNMTEVVGRVLPTPKLLYAGSSIIPKDGVWSMQNKRFVDARSMRHFGVINITNRRVNDQQIERFMTDLTAAGRSMGMTVDKHLFIRHVAENSLEAGMRAAKKDFPKLQIIFVIINRKGDPAYEIVKRVGDLELMVTTQCVQFKNVLGKGFPDPATMSNICLKLNSKLGGVNNLIDQSVRPRVLKDEQIIIMGADVTHPGADQQDADRPSIAAVVGSVDPRASQYCAEIRIQAPKQEYIEDMEDMVYNILRKFNRANYSTSTGKPQRIIFFRDGVSEGQFAKVQVQFNSVLRIV